MIPYKFNQLGISNNKSIYPENASVFRINGKSITQCSFTPIEDCIVDVGDGNQYIFPGSKSFAISHSYSVSGDYIIQIIGNHSIFKAPKETIEAIQLSNTINDCTGMFGGNAYVEGPDEKINLQYIADGFAIPNNVTSCYGMFTGCQIKNIPKSLCIPNGVTDCRYMFRWCKQLLLHDNFKMPESILDAYDMFFGCTSITNDINNILPNIFLQNEEIILGEAFAYCENLRGIVPADKLWNSGKTFSSGSCFRNCTSLDNYDEIPDDWK